MTVAPAAGRITGVDEALRVAAGLADQFAVDAARRTVEITNEQYTTGVIDFTPVFIFQATLTDQQDQLAQSRGDIALNLIALYRALGGGWEMRLAREGKGS